MQFSVMNSLIKPNYAYQDEQGRLRDIFRKTFGNEHRTRVTLTFLTKVFFHNSYLKRSEAITSNRK